MNNQFGRLAFACTSMLILTACGGGGAANAPQTQSPPPAGTYVPIDSRTGTSTALTGDGVYVSRVRTHNQNMTVAARAIAERNTVGDLS